MSDRRAAAPGRKRSRRMVRLIDTLSRWGFMLPAFVFLMAVLAYPLL